MHCRKIFSTERRFAKTIIRMSALSDSIVTRLVGYDLEPGVFNDTAPNLPIAIGILAEANTNMQDSLNTTTPTIITNAAQAAALGGWGSPIYQIAKILFPLLGGFPVYVYPQIQAMGATSKRIHISVTGTATNNGTHYVKLCGRNSIAGTPYAINIVSGDDAGVIHGKISDAINNALGAPCKGMATDYYAELESQWKGLTANEVNAVIDTNNNALGLTYVVDNTIQAGAATPSIQPALDQFKNTWITHVINSYGLVDVVMDTLEAFNGAPVVGLNPPTGRYLPTVWKPFKAFSGFVTEDPSDITDGRLNNLTIETCPAPLSLGLSMEAAANYCALKAINDQNTPELDICGQAYPDMPTPVDIGLMSDWQERDRMVKKGCSTVTNISGVYVVQDSVTTYHPIGENPPQFRFSRNIIIDWNTRFTYLILEENNVLNKVIAKDTDTVAANIQVIKPKTWKAVLADMADQLVLRGLWVDAPFTVTSTIVQLSTVNPDRLNTSFKYKRSGYTRQADTTATAGFSLGTLTAN